MTSTSPSSPWADFTGYQIKSIADQDCSALYVVSSPGRDSHDLRSSRLAEATQKALGTNALLNWFRYIYLVPSPHLSNIYKIVI